MSTSTPRIQRIDYYIRNSENACAISEAIELQEELTAANARIAELEKTQDICHCGQRMIDHGWQDGHGGTPNNELCAYAEQVIEYREKVESLTRQLAEAQAQLEASKKLASDRLIGLCKCGNEREELQAQLASAREAMEKFTAILSDLLCNVPNWGSPEYVAELIQKALDSARGVTSPPAAVELQVCDRPWSEYPIGTKAHAFNGGHWTRVDGGWRWGNRGGIFPTPGGDACGKCVELPSPPAVAETGEKGALTNSQETEGLEPFTPINPPRFGTLTTSWGEECTVKVYGSLDDGKVALFNYTTEGRLVTGAMAPMDSIEFDSPMTPPPQGKEARE